MFWLRIAKQTNSIAPLRVSDCAGKFHNLLKPKRIMLILQTKIIHLNSLRHAFYH